MRRTFGDIFELAPGEIPDDASVGNMPGWDSLRQLELMLALELEFGVRIPTDAMLDLQSVAAIEQFLAEYEGV